MSERHEERERGFSQTQRRRNGELKRLTFHNGVGLEDLLFNPRVLARDGSQKLQDQLGGLGLAGARFAGDDAALVASVAAHGAVSCVCHGENVRRQRANGLVLVHFHVLAVVNVEHLVRVDCDQNGARVGLSGVGCMENKEHGCYGARGM